MKIRKLKKQILRKWRITAQMMIRKTIASRWEKLAENIVQNNSLLQRLKAVK